MTTNLDQAKTFINALFDETDRFIIRPIETWVEGSRKRSNVDHQGIRYCTPMVFTVSFDGIAKRSAAERTNTFFGVCPRFGGDKRETFDLAWQIRTVRHLWSDFDEGGPDEALSRCADAGLPDPSIVVSSGNGAHLYWLLDAPYMIDDVDAPPPVKTDWIDKKPIHYYENGDGRVYLEDPKTRKVIAANRPDLSEKAQHLQDIVAGIAGKIGGDHTQDLSRILRVPGTLNRKNERNGQETVPCELISIDGDLRYSIEQFEHFAEESPDKKRREVLDQVDLPTPRKMTAHKRDSLNEYILQCRIAQDRSAADYALCIFAIEKGIAKEAVWSEVESVGKFKERGETYFDLTWTKAVRVARERKLDRAEKKAASTPAKSTSGNDGESSDEGLIKLLGDGICDADHSDHFAQDAGGKLYRYSGGVYRGKGEQFIKKQVKRLLHEYERTAEWSPRLAEAVVEWIRVDAPELWERPPDDVVNVNNGLLDTKTRQLRPHSPEFLSCIQLPVTFDPQATCPETDKFDRQVFPNDAIEFAHELPGWLMVPQPIQKAVLLIGEGGNGKSRKLTQLRAFLGSSNVSSVSLHKLESDRFAPARLLGRLANVCPDLPSDHLAGTSMFKAITGGDVVNAEHKFCDSFDFAPFARLVFSANHPPRSEDSSDGFFERWLVVPFQGKFRGTAEEIPEDVLDRRLSSPQELSGLLNHALNGLDRIRAIGGFSEPPSIRAAHAEFHATTDPLAVWLDQFTVDDPDAVVPKQLLRTAYGGACEQRDRPRPSDTAFGNTMKRLRPSVATAQRTVNGRVQRCYVGIGLNDGPSDASHTSQGSQGLPLLVPHSYQQPSHPPTNLSHARNREDRDFDSSVEQEGVNPVNPVNHVNAEGPVCDHLNPSAWVHRDGKAYCPGCGKHMGRV